MMGIQACGSEALRGILSKNTLTETKGVFLLK